MSRWLQFAISQTDLNHETDKTDNTPLAASRPAPVTPADGVLSDMSDLSGRGISQGRVGVGQQPMPERAYPHGQDLYGNPKTWTGFAVSPEAWRGMSYWERHGSAGKVWNGLSRAWEPAQTPDKPCI